MTKKTREKRGEAYAFFQELGLSPDEIGGVFSLSSHCIQRDNGKLEKLHTASLEIIRLYNLKQTKR